MMMLITLSRKRIPKTTVTRSFIVLFMSFLLLANLSCKSSKPRVITTKKEAAKRYNNKDYASSRTTKTVPSDAITERATTVKKTSNAENKVINKAVKKAISYTGTPYKYGGSSINGMDCSGLIYVSYKDAGKNVPRTSLSLYNASNPLDFKQVQKGDLLFFATGTNKTQVSHVGLVVKTTPAEVSFIHASSSRGVMVSNMNNVYWLNAYVSAGRLK